MKILIISMLITLTAGCGSEPDTSAEKQKFENFQEHFLDQLWQMSPGWASWAGLHQYDSVLVQPTPENRSLELITLGELANSLEGIDLKKLSDNDKIDYYLIRDYLKSSQWYSEEFKSFEWNPANYNIANRAGRIINENFTDLTTRLRILSAYLNNVPSYYESAVKNITTPTLEHLELGLIQNRGGLTVFGESLQDSISISSLDDNEKAVLKERINMTKDAISGYIASLEEMRSKYNIKTARSPRIGKELFFAKYKHDINTDYTAEEIYLKALSEKKTLHNQMIAISDSIWDNYLPEVNKPADELVMVKMLIDKISEKHVKKEDYFTEIKKQIKELTDFVNEKDLLTQDPTKPLVVRELPLYMRGGGAGASVSSPGPYDKKANTYYNVEPLDGYTEKEAESYLREYNHYILQILNIHEAIPGHYTQLVYGNKSPSIIKSILQNGAMIEGWANYSELMMLEAGYNNSPEMWLMRGKWHLRGVTNTILDYSFHVLDLNQDGAMKLMVDEAFQQQTEADNKWRRLNLSSVQLSSYFTGFSQIYELREEIKKLKGEDFDLKQFHEQFLGYGNAPVKYIRELMLSSIN